MKSLTCQFLFLCTTNVFSQKDYGCATGQERVEAMNSSLEKEVLHLVIIERENENLTLLKWNDELSYSARYHSKDMAVDRYFNHDSYNRLNGLLFKACDTFIRINNFYVSGTGIAENISAGKNTAEAIVNGWMKSKGHKANILRKDAKYLGVGFYTDENSHWTHYCVQCFGI